MHCWKKTDLLKAWERPAQLEASAKIKELFPNLADVPVVDLSLGRPNGRKYYIIFCQLATVHG